MQRRRTKFPLSLAAGGSVALAIGLLAGCSSESSAPATENCTPEHEFETLEPGVLTIATYDFPPYTEIEGSDTLNGVEGEILTEFAARECLSLNIQSAGGAGAVIPSIETNRADTGAGDWYRTDARAEIVRMGAPTVVDISAIISLDGITSDELDQGYRVAAVSGSLWNENLQAWLGDDFTVYQDSQSIYTDLESGRIDAIIASAAEATVRFENQPIEGVTIEIVEPNEHVTEFAQPGQVNFPTNYDNEALGEALDAQVQAMREDGTLEEIVTSYGLDPAVTLIEDVYNL